MATKEKINLLEVIPCRNEHIKAEQEGETIVLSFPRFKRSWMSRYLLPKGMSKDIHVRQEDRGTAVWNLKDGNITILDNIEKLADDIQYEAGYDSRLSTYLSQLQKDGFIKWIIIH